MCVQHYLFSSEMFIVNDYVRTTVYHVCTYTLLTTRTSGPVVSHRPANRKVGVQIPLEPPGYTLVKRAV